MIPLNLPDFDIKLAGTPNRPTILDILRRKYVALTPEEWVRQHFIHFLINYKKYPATLLANEVELKVGQKRLRADTILYSKDLKPLMILEYKAPHITITQKTFDQISVYNMLLHVDYLIVSNGLQHYCCKMDYNSKKYLFLEDIPESALIRNTLFEKYYKVYLLLHTQKSIPPFSKSGFFLSFLYIISILFIQYYVLVHHLWNSTCIQGTMAFMKKWFILRINMNHFMP